MPQLADFDADTQQKATDAFQKFLAVYHVNGNVIEAEELGSAVQAAVSAGDDGFEKALFDALIPALYERMKEAALDGREGPDGLDATMRRSLIQRFSQLPAARTPHSKYVYRVHLDDRTFEAVVYGPKVGADQPVVGGPLGDAPVDNFRARVDAGEIAAIETTRGRSVFSGDAFKLVVADAVDIKVEGPIKVV
jgi:hypothetical protein